MTQVRMVREESHTVRGRVRMCSVHKMSNLELPDAWKCISKMEFSGNFMEKKRVSQ